MENTAIIRYGELGLKRGSTRTGFERALIRNMKAALKSEGIEGTVHTEWGRIFIDTPHVEPACQVLSRVFGVVSCSPAWRTEFKKIEDIITACVKYAEGKIEKNKTFAIRSSRAGNHDFTSQDVARKAGAAIVEKYGAKVNLTKPDVELHIETRQKETYLFSGEVRGPGGLPMGVEGKVVCLMSGGIDSPVAIWMMMKRGCLPVLVHMDLKPFGDDENIKRVKTLIEKIQNWAYGARLKTYFVPHGENLAEYMRGAPRRITCVLCKRTMLKTAEKIAASEHALGIVTGESLGQVASQTLTNLNVENQAVRMPVFRPLIGMDKEEIVEIAKKIGTYESSISPVTCCGAVPEHPETKAELDVIEDEENFLKVDELIDKAIQNAVIER